MKRVESLAGFNAALMRQGMALVSSLPDDAYQSVGSSRPGGGVGSQLRHVFDYYGCFLRDLGEARIDYDRREREAAIEQSRELAVSRMSTLADALEALGRDREDAALDVRMEGDVLPEGVTPWARSSLVRELHFLASHTVHHFALVAIMLRARGIEVPRNLGVAPSTLSHWNRSS